MGIEDSPEGDEKLLTLRDVFSPDDALVTGVISQLAHLAQMQHPLLTKSQVLSAVELSTVLNIAFWASLRSNEGPLTRVRLLVADANIVQSGASFEQPVPLNSVQVARLAPAVPSGGCLAVSGSKMVIWGIILDDPGRRINAVSIMISAPGVLRLGVGLMRPYAAVADGKATLLRTPWSSMVAISSSLITPISAGPPPQGRLSPPTRSCFHVTQQHGLGQMSKRSRTGRPRLRPRRPGRASLAADSGYRLLLREGRRDPAMLAPPWEVSMAATKMTPGQRKKIGRAQAASWKRLTPKQRAARIAKMHAWRKK